jgi:hypothetical protein
MGHVLVHGPGLSLGGCGWDSVLCAELQQLLPSWEPLEEFGESPWCDDFDGGLDSEECKLESNLIIAFACASMAHSRALLTLGSSHHCACNYWPSQAGA